MRKVPVFLLAVCLTALLAGCAGQAVPLRGAAQLGALSAAAVTSEAVSDEKQDVPAPADAPDEEDPTKSTQDAKPQGNAQQPESKADAPESPVPDGEGQPDVPEQPTTPEQPVMPAPAPTPAEELEQTVPKVTPEPVPTPKPAASGNIYSIAEAIQAGNEYARAQYGVTIDTSMTAAVKGNVDATFACLAAMDGAETVSAYARFNCTVRYDATSDEYIVVVLYG